MMPCRMCGRLGILDDDGYCEEHCGPTVDELLYRATSATTEAITSVFEAEPQTIEARRLYAVKENDAA